MLPASIKHNFPLPDLLSKIRKLGRAMANTVLLAAMLPCCALALADDGDAQPAGSSGFIQGNVSDLSANPLSGATVNISEQSSGTLLAQTTTDGNGDYNVPIGPDTYVVEASKQFYISSTTTDVVVNSNETVMVNFVLERGTGDITGEVLDSDANSIEGAEVSLVDQDSGTLIVVLTTDVNGEFSIPNMFAGNYMITIEATDFVPYSEEIVLETNETEFVNVVLLDPQIFRDRFEATN